MKAFILFNALNMALNVKIEIKENPTEERKEKSLFWQSAKSIAFFECVVHTKQLA